MLVSFTLAFLNLRQPTNRLNGTLPDERSIDVSLSRARERPFKEERITDHLSIGLYKNGRVMTIINGVPFIQCRKAIIILKDPESEERLRKRLENVKNMDEFLKARTNDERHFDDTSQDINPETEFFVHKSSLEAWVQSGYNIDVIDSRIAFPILLVLQKHDEAASNALYFEIERRWADGNDASRKALLETITTRQPDGSTIDPGFFVRFFNSMDEPMKKWVMELPMAVNLRESLDPRYKIESEKKQRALFIFLYRNWPSNFSESYIDEYVEKKGESYFHDTYRDKYYLVFTGDEATREARLIMADMIVESSPEYLEKKIGVAGVSDVIKASYKIKGKDLRDFALKTLLEKSSTGLSRSDEKGFKEYIPKLNRLIDAFNERRDPGNPVEVTSLMIRQTIGFEKLIDDAIDDHGRGNVLGTASGIEHNIIYDGTTFYIYEVD